MGDEGHTEWLPPKAPGAAPPRRWESVDEVPQWPPPAAPAPPAAAPQPIYAIGPPLAGARGGNGAAIASLVLGIAGLLTLVLGSGLFFFVNLPCSVLAWVLGVQARRRVQRGETNARLGMAQSGMVLGIIGTILGGLAIIAWAIAFAVSEELRDYFEREIERRQREQ